MLCVIIFLFVFLCLLYYTIQTLNVMLINLILLCLLCCCISLCEQDPYISGYKLHFTPELNNMNKFISLTKIQSVKQERRDTITACTYRCPK